jgi:hypothetical protein
MNNLLYPGKTREGANPFPRTSLGKIMWLQVHNKAIKNRPQKAWAGLANARLLLRRYMLSVKFFCLVFAKLLVQQNS